jgi:hypothetical protein
MLHVPLLSDAYAAALFGTDSPRTEPAPQEGGSGRLVPLRPETPRSPVDDEGDEEDVDAAPSDRDDIETARTRPLRLDQLHL